MESRVQARVVEPADGRERGFWEHWVHYPYEVEYATIEHQGRAWQLAYMDVGERRAGTKTLVIIHGKGANSGHYGDVIESAVAEGVRVIAIDMPHFGKSIAGNLENPITRTLDDIRVMIHELVVRRLGVARAAYFGHSLGGQVVIGYAMSYPEAVTALLLEAPAGLEEFWPEVDYKFADAMRSSVSAWLSVWRDALRDEFRKNADVIEDMFARRETLPYARPEDDTHFEFVTAPTSFGYFIEPEAPYARFLTDCRVQMIHAAKHSSPNRRQLETWCAAYVRDVYSIGSEVRVSDPNSLPKRVARGDLKCPRVLLQFGLDEPFIPNASLSGKHSLRDEIIAPFVSSLERHGVAVDLRLYDKAAHFPHTDVADTFKHDVVRFLQTLDE